MLRKKYRGSNPTALRAKLAGAPHLDACPLHGRSDPEEKGACEESTLLPNPAVQTSPVKND